MLLGESNFELKIGDWKLSCNFRFLKNLYNYIESDPIKFLFDWTNKMDNDTETTIIIQSMVGELVDVSELLRDEELKVDILTGLAQLIQSSFTIKEEKDTNTENKNKSKSENNDKFDFEDFYNRWYYFARVILHMTEDEFLDSNVTTLSMLEKAHKDYQKGILIGTYVDIENAKAKAMKDNTNDKDNDKKNTITISKDNNIRIRDIWK